MKRVPEHGPPALFAVAKIRTMPGLSGGSARMGQLWPIHTLTAAQQGAKGYAHGGASAAMLDEVMGVSVWRAGVSGSNGQFRSRVSPARPVGGTHSRRG